MRPKENYTKEEYNNLKKELDDAKKRLKYAEDKLKDLRVMYKILGGMVNSHKILNKEQIEEIIKNEIEKYYKLYEKPYYKEIENCVNQGITDVKEIAKVVNKSYATVRRALIDMNLWPVPKKDMSSYVLD